MGLNFSYIPGQTPLNEEERNGLLIPTIAIRSELDEYEQQNIEDAVQWIMTHSISRDRILSEKFVLDLHERMFDKVWEWAGSFRHSNKNLGVDHWVIPTALRSLIEDALYWTDNETYDADEMAVRFKHRLVSIHCFPNGNGRHSRLIADVIIRHIYQRPMFSWGSGDLVRSGDQRNKYLKAVKEADSGVFENLLKFSRS